MKLKINGELTEICLRPNPATLSMLIKHLGHRPELIVIEYNGTILVPNKWDEQELSDGDSLEIVTIVGGGS